MSGGIRFLPRSSDPLGDIIFDSPSGETRRNRFGCLHGWNRKRFETDGDGGRRDWIGIRWYFRDNCSRSAAFRLLLPLRNNEPDRCNLNFGSLVEQVAILSPCAGCSERSLKRPPVTPSSSPVIRVQCSPRNRFPFEQNSNNSSSYSSFFLF